MSQNINDLPPVPASFDWQAFRENAHQTIDLIVDYQQGFV